MKKFLNKLRSQRKNIILSLIIAMVISFVCYLMNNCPYPYWDSLDKFCWMEYIVSNTIDEKFDRSDALFVNVSYDKAVAEYTYSNGNLKGTVNITNRETLIKFLKVMEQTNVYKYIFLDIRFEKGVETPADAELFSLISRMRDVSYSAHSDLENNENADPQKAALNDYFTTITSTNFTRYQFIQNGTVSAPLRIYLSIDSANNKPITQFGPFFVSNGRLCQNSPFVRIPEDFYEGHGYEGHQNYYDLGPVLLDMNDENDWIYDTKDKIVIVGDFVNDLNDTYIGLQPGSYLVYLAYKELAAGKHFVSWPFICFMIIVYVLISMFILNRQTLWAYIPFLKNIKNRFVLFILDMIGYSAVLIAISIVLYLFFRTTYNIFFPSLFFSMLTLLISYKYISK